MPGGTGDLWSWGWLGRKRTKLPVQREKEAAGPSHPPSPAPLCRERSEGSHTPALALATLQPVLCPAGPPVLPPPSPNNTAAPPSWRQARVSIRATCLFSGSHSLPRKMCEVPAGAWRGGAPAWDSKAGQSQLLCRRDGWWRGNESGPSTP